MKLMKKVENMKKKGKFDKEELAKLGINVKDENTSRQDSVLGFAGEDEFNNSSIAAPSDISHL